MAASAKKTSLGFFFSQTKSASRALSRTSSMSATMDAKNSISASNKSSGITERRSWNTATGLNGSFKLAGDNIIEQASASNQSTLPCSLRFSSIAARAADEKACHMDE
jgi:hypothetical protein